MTGFCYTKGGYTTTRIDYPMVGRDAVLKQAYKLTIFPYGLARKDWKRSAAPPNRTQPG